MRRLFFSGSQDSQGLWKCHLISQPLEEIAQTLYVLAAPTKSPSLGDV